MKHKMRTLAVVVMSGFAVFAAPTVTKVKVQQQQPKNAFVDIDVTVRGLTGCEKKFLKIEAIDKKTKEPVLVSSFTPETSAVMELSLVSNGTYRLVWDTREDLKDSARDSLRIKASLTDESQGGGVRLWANGPRFATCNVGARRPDEVGYYFWWGDTNGYKYVNNNWESNDGKTKGYDFWENTPSNNKNNDKLEQEGWIEKGELVSAHDAATAHWGCMWRLPTEKEIAELCNNCIWKWVRHDSITGYMVRGTGDYEKAWIFLPACGFGSGKELRSLGRMGAYHSSTPASYDPNAYHGLDIVSGEYQGSRSLRVLGHSVRAVSDGSSRKIKERSHSHR